MKRTRFLIGAVAGLSVAANLDNLFGRALAQPILPGLPGGADDRVLVVINMQGGNDGLNTIVPHGMPQYYKYRPTLGIAPGDVLQIDKQLGFNPAMTSLKGMFDAGNVAVVQGAGYPGPITRIFARRRFGRPRNRSTMKAPVGSGVFSTARIFPRTISLTRWRCRPSSPK